MSRRCAGWRASASRRMGPATKYRGVQARRGAWNLLLAFEGACTTRCGLVGKEDGVVLPMLCILAASESGFKGGNEIFLSEIFMRRQSAVKENGLRNRAIRPRRSPMFTSNLHSENVDQPPRLHTVTIEFHSAHERRGDWESVFGSREL